ncbi:Uncharacterised protein [Mesomycoplasma neurolyticum]|uniref:Uncharacterized protein n=1 Tax=Mesomycoplasma neurolyticum TaxID=2120 RepID=A0A449A5Q0_9BACT|nr:Uncharacterised protein [Mesomycoplasma neurolyticum]
MVTKNKKFLKTTAILNIVFYIVVISFIARLYILFTFELDTIGTNLFKLLGYEIFLYTSLSYFLLFIIVWFINLIKLIKFFGINKKTVLLWMIFPFVSLFQKEKVNKILN